ncbi:SMT3 protein [Salpingoeca rosetta]|uniref:SMT3 protein n=1 Tax=Salpingoeca rosetta (strain ATCC 50818 / BSB-021) TaxID=946362 RepID=F2TX96_SALR5|nr:SMT3 protein [Salpingoeca rosetta]EGD76005.1 SMT3 protein [Salpingoeca rosetta]|eukprot:XP_004998180.1 SMT3 protein [Salpingoeca rosetta]
MADQQQQDVKPKVKAEGGDETQYVNLKVNSQDGTTVQFKIKTTTQLKKLMDTFCQRQGLNKASVRFLFDGQAIKEKDTPALLEMENNDVIDVFAQQTGGCFLGL